MIFFLISKRYRPFVLEDQGQINGDFNEPLIKRLFMPSSKECNTATSRLVNIVAVTNGILESII